MGFIVRQLLKLLGSELHIKSEYEKGSEFSFELVQKVTDSKELGDFRKKLSDVSERVEYKTEFTAPHAQILVVDDSQMNLKVFRNLLKDTQIRISEAESGERCLELLKLQDFDLIFLDHMMPEMDGIETLHAMHEQGLGKGTPVIMLTANAIPGSREKYIEEGFDDFLSKPIVSENLFQMIQHFLSEECIMEQKKKQNADDIWDKIPEIDFEMGMTTCSGDKDFYLELLQDFTKLPIREELAGLLKGKDFKNYCIRIHGFKNNAYSIGARKLGDLALEMEKCTREGFPENIEELQQRLLVQYDSICLKYRAIMDQKDIQKK